MKAGQVHIELEDANTRAVLGDYISVYDIEGRRGPCHRADLLRKPPGEAGSGRDSAADDRSRFEEATEGEEIERKEKLKTRWAQLEDVASAGPRVRLIARDIVEDELAF